MVSLGEQIKYGAKTAIDTLISRWTVLGPQGAKTAMEGAKAVKDIRDVQQDKIEGNREAMDDPKITPEDSYYNPPGQPLIK